MTSIGGLLAILGFGSLVLPAFGLQFKLLSAVEGAQPWFGVVLGVVGLVLLVVGFMRNGKRQEQQLQQPQQT
jgi:hypothetical protein